MVGAITGVIGILPIVFRDATDLDSLTVSVDSADSEFAPVFAVPVDAAWETFPASSSVCDAAQLAWLEANGMPLAERYLVSVANTAREGAVMSLKEFRGIGDVVLSSPTHIAVTCDQTGAGASNLRAAALDAASGQSAVFTQANSALPDNPLVFNLAPGENGQFALALRSSAAFTGSIVFVAALGAESREVELPLGEIDLPATAPVRFTIVDGSLACDGVEGCSVDDVLAALG